MCAGFPVLVPGLYCGSEYLTPVAGAGGGAGYTLPAGGC